MPTAFEESVRRPMKDLSDDLKAAQAKQHETQAKLDLALNLIAKQDKQYLELLDHSREQYQDNKFLKYQLEAADLTITKLYREGKRA